MLSSLGQHGPPLLDQQRRHRLRHLRQPCLRHHRQGRDGHDHCPCREVGGPGQGGGLVGQDQDRLCSFL